MTDNDRKKFIAIMKEHLDKKGEELNGEAEHTRNALKNSFNYFKSHFK